MLDGSNQSFVKMNKRLTESQQQQVPVAVRYRSSSVDVSRRNPLERGTQNPIRLYQDNALIFPPKSTPKTQPEQPAKGIVLPTSSDTNVPSSYLDTAPRRNSVRGPLRVSHRATEE